MTATLEPRKASGLADRLEESLRAQGTAERAAAVKAYLKSDLNFLGVDTKTLRREVKALLRELPDLDRPGLLALVEALWRGRIFERRNAALLVNLLPLRRGEGDFDRFARYADAMLGEKEFFVRKAIGWVLRETGKRRAGLVAAWLLPRAARASGVTVREAVKYLGEDDREAILAAYRG